MILQPLSELLPRHYEPGIGREPIPPFFAEFKGRVYTVKSVLERTAVLMNTEDFYDRRLGKLTEVLVDPAILTWRADSGSRFTDGGQPDPAGRARLRGRVASLVTNSAKKAEARKKGNLASQASAGQRRFNGSVLATSPSERELLRREGKARCPTCKNVYERSLPSMSYCKPCQRDHTRRLRAAWKEVIA